MTEWEATVARVEAIHKRGRRCYICGGVRKFKKQALDARNEIDRTTWECIECGVVETLEMPVFFC